MYLRLLLLLTGLSLPNLFSAQDTASFPDLKIGEWRQHQPWQRAKSVSVSPENVYFSTEWALVEIDKADRSPRYLTKVEGLSDVGLESVRYNDAVKALLLAYTNANIDLYYPEEDKVINLPFIKTNLNLTGDKTINHIAFDGSYALMATGFGMVRLNLATQEVDFTVFTPAAVQTVAVFDQQYFIGAEQGLYSIPVNDPNPADFSRWSPVSNNAGLPVGKSITALQTFQNQLYIGVDTFGLYQYDGDVAALKTTVSGHKVHYLTAEGEGLVIGWRRDIFGSVAYINTQGNITDIHWACNAVFPRYAVEDGQGRYWIADEQDGFRYYDAATGECDIFEFNSPFTHYCDEIVVKGNEVFVGSRGAQTDFSPGYFRDGVFVRGDDGAWRRISLVSNPELEANSCHVDLWRVAPHPTEDRLYAGSFVGGLVELESDGSSTCYTKNNSILQAPVEAGAGRTAIGGLAFDGDNNLWICNYNAPQPIAVLKADGTWAQFDAPRDNLLQVAVDDNNYKWFAVGFSGGLMVYDSGDDIDDPSDDQTKVFTTANSVLASNLVNCVAPDLNGDVWVGTRAGIYSFECGSSVFSEENPCKGTRQIVNVDGFNGYLLEDEDVRTIAIDGANRKWVGTGNGVYVLSSDGREQVAHFTSTNSPLFDNTINDIAINGKTGEVWIGTVKGILSLRADATEGGRVNSRTAYAYPNPVRPDYDGPIAIYGLARDANVKITDVAGNLVFEGTALGGQAVWNGRDYQGRRAASGVYLIYATSSETFDAPDAVITKVVIMN